MSTWTCPSHGRVLYIRWSSDHIRARSAADRCWNFSPAYDLNPTNETTQGILISRQTNESSLQELLSAHNDYFLTEKEAKNIIDSVRQGMRQWQTVANQCRISKSEQERFAKRFEVNLM